MIVGERNSFTGIFYHKEAVKMEQGYVFRHLQAGDEIVAQAKITKISLVPGILVGVFFGWVFYGIGHSMSDVFPGTNLIGPIIGALIILYCILAMKNTELAVTKKKVAGKTGVFGNHNMDAPLDKVNTVSVHRGLFGSIFGYSTLEISTASGAFQYKGVDMADAFKDTVMRQIDVYNKEKQEEEYKRMASMMQQNLQNQQNM